MFVLLICLLSIVHIVIVSQPCNASEILSPPRPNIIFILTDDMGWNDVGFTGRSDIQTPNIDALAYHGRILTQHYSQPTCTPSRAALLTGKYPIRTGMQGFPLSPGEPRALPMDQRLLSHYLKDLGYQTHLLGKWHLGCHEWKHTPTTRGFDTHFGYLNGFVGYYNHTLDILNTSGYDFWRGSVPQYHLRGRYVTDLLTEEAVRLIETKAKQGDEKPMFLLISHLAPHTGNPGNLHEYPEEDLERFNYIPDLNRRKYAAMMWNLDKSVGLIVKSLAETKLLNDSIIVFTSDNGAATIGLFPNDGSNYPLRGIKFTMFEGGILSPAIVWNSQIHMQQSRDVFKQLFHITDWLPTLYKAAGGELRELSGLDGHNQWDSLLAEDQTTQNEYQNRKEMLLNIDEVLGLQGLRYRQWKLISGAYLNGSLDGYWGDYTQASYVYKLIDINKSLVSLSLRSLPFNTEPLTKEEIQKMRSKTVINCDVNENVPGPQLPKFIPCVLSESPCLFDISNDPCERSNLASTLHDVTTTLATKLETYMQQLKPQLNEPIDQLSNPKYYNNTYIPWREPYFKKRFRNAPLTSSANYCFKSSFLSFLIPLFLQLLFSI